MREEAGDVEERLGHVGGERLLDVAVDRVVGVVDVSLALVLVKQPHHRLLLLGAAE